MSKSKSGTAAGTQDPPSDVLGDGAELGIRCGSESSQVVSQLSATADEFFPVKPRRRRRYPRKSVNTGTAEIDADDNAFAGRDENDKKAWLFISRVKDGVTEKTVKDYILKKTQLDGKDVSVQSIDTTYERKDNKCFQVGIKFQLKDRLYESDFWPKGVAYHRFRFVFNTHEKSTNSFLGQR